MMNSCKDVAEQTSDYTDGELSWANWAQFRFHILLCPKCKEYLDQMNLTKHLLSDSPPEEVAPEVKDELLARFRDWKSKQ